MRAGGLGLKVGRSRGRTRITNATLTVISSVTLDKPTPQEGDTITATATVTPGSPTPNYTWTWIVSP